MLEEPSYGWPNLRMPAGPEPGAHSAAGRAHKPSAPGTQVRLDGVSIQALVDTSRTSAQRWLAAEPRDRLGQSVAQAVARAEALLPLLLPVSNRCLADRHWAAIFALLPVSPRLQPQCPERSGACSAHKGAAVALCHSLLTCLDASYSMHWWSLRTASSERTGACAWLQPMVCLHPMLTSLPSFTPASRMRA